MARTSPDIGLVHILIALDVIAEMAISPDYAADVAACEIQLRQVKSRAELILRFIEATQPRPTKIGRLQ